MGNIEIEIKSDVKKIVEETIAIEVVRALDISDGDIVRGIVKEALNRKKSSYSDRTLLGEYVYELASESAKEAFRSILEERKEEIALEVRKQLDEKDDLVAGLVTKMLEALPEALTISFVKMVYSED